MTKMIITQHTITLITTTMFPNPTHITNTTDIPSTIITTNIMVPTTNPIEPNQIRIIQ